MLAESWTVFTLYDAVLALRVRVQILSKVPYKEDFFSFCQVPIGDDHHLPFKMGGEGSKWTWLSGLYLFRMASEEREGYCVLLVDNKDRLILLHFVLVTFLIGRTLGCPSGALQVYPKSKETKYLTICLLYPPLPPPSLPPSLPNNSSMPDHTQMLYHIIWIHTLCFHGKCIIYITVYA